MLHKLQNLLWYNSFFEYESQICKHALTFEFPFFSKLHNPTRGWNGYMGRVYIYIF